MSNIYRFAQIAALSITCWLAGMPAHAAEVGDATALEEYVYTPDPAYNYTLVDTQDLPGFTFYTLLMDSLQWRSPEDVGRTLWTHQVLIIVPDVVTTETALMLINGGSDPFDTVDPVFVSLAAVIASSAGSVLAAVSQIPNQPLQFPDEGSPISEDALVAYSWDKALATGDGTWAAYMPMTKASVRGMDTVQDFVNGNITGLTIDDFVVFGYSKRGATAWLVAAVDPRVRAAAPGVFDVLNMAVQIDRHWEAYGFYAPAIGDYADYDIVRRVRSPEGRWLAEIVDPFSYARMLEIPKFVLSSTGDQFFLPDAAHFYLDGLFGETLIRQIPNTDHGLTNGQLQALDSLLAWYKTVVADVPRPQMDWNLNEDGVLEVKSNPPADTAKLWQATNSAARDFRLESIGTAWTATVLTEESPGSWEVLLAEPEEGWTGYLVELSFPGVDGPPAQTYTTPVFVLPDGLPFVIDDPVIDPKTARYWRCQLPDAPVSECPRPPQLSPDALESLLRVPLFGEYVSDLDDLATLMTNRDSAEDRARLACMAVRLNIASAEFGWYSSIRVDRSGERLWQVYQRAEQAFADERPGQGYTAVQQSGSAGPRIANTVAAINSAVFQDPTGMDSAATRRHQ